MLRFLIPFVALAGCSEDFVATGGAGGGTTNTTGGGGSGGTAGAGGQTTTTPTQACATLTNDACSTCLVDACATPYCACAKSSDCVDLLVCTADAQTVSDYEQCWSKHKDSIALVGQLQTCGSKQCSDCKLPPVDKCLACEYEKCATEIDNCFGNAKCTGLLTCLQPCPNQPNPGECQTNCTDMFSDGVQPVQQLYTCATTHCATPCAP
jgi:hypothetical protein